MNYIEIVKRKSYRSNRLFPSWPSMKRMFYNFDVKELSSEYFQDRDNIRVWSIKLSENWLLFSFLLYSCWRVFVSLKQNFIKKQWWKPIVIWCWLQYFHKCFLNLLITYLLWTSLTDQKFVPRTEDNFEKRYGRKLKWKMTQQLR